MVLADHGADVVKVESPQGDDTRAWGPPFLGGEGAAAADTPGESTYYLFCNRNKRSISLDLSTDNGREAVRRLARRSDVVVENFKRGTLERWGLDFATLSQDNPGLILANISGFGSNGPKAALPGYDVIAQAMGGLMHLTGDPAGDPARAGVPIADLVTGYLTVIGVLMALEARHRTGVGQRIECSLLDSVISLLASSASSYLNTGAEPGRSGNTHPSLVPYQTFPTADGTVYIAAGNDRQFRDLCAVLDRSALADDPRFFSNAARVEHRHELELVLSDVFRTAPTTAWIDRCWQAGVPAGAIRTISEVFADPQVEAREMVVSVAHPSIDRGVVMTGIPIKLSATPGSVRRHPPLRGEHTEEILREIGLDRRGATSSPAPLSNKRAPEEAP
jgi:crotonobetainyl-CoA:carnitine CoA-transferase CaiB-like acyl-CoA transferase